MKKGFTLIELLAVITVLAIVLAIAVPKLSGINKKVRRSTFETNSNGIISVCRNHYQSNYASRLDANEIVYKIENGKITVDGVDVKYNEGEINEEGEIIINEDGESRGYVKNNEYCGIKEYKTSIEVHEMVEGEECGNTHQIYLTVELNGGTLEPSIEGSYTGGSSINLPSPTKAGYEFKNWVVAKGSASIEENKLNLYHTDVTIYALYKVGVRLTVDKNGGSSSQTFNENYNTGEIIELEDLEKRGYNFTGWEVTSGNSLLSGKTLTIGNTDTSIQATFELASYVCNAGEYLKKGEISCTTCPAGSYCPGGTYNYNPNEDQGKTNCPGSMTSNANSSLITHCKITCSGGTYLAKSGSACSNCTAGNYCAGGTYNYSDSGNQGLTSCGTGKTSIAGAKSSSDCFMKIQTYNYTGGMQTFQAPATGTYKLEVYGAQGGNASAAWYADGKMNFAKAPGGNGGYAAGNIYITKGATLYIYVGGQGGGTDYCDHYGGSGGYNGGAAGGNNANDAGDDAQGRCTRDPGGGGGGATDIRYSGTALSNRIIVAGGGGGAGSGTGADPGGGNNGNGNLLNGTAGCSSDGGSGGGGGGYYGGKSDCEVGGGKGYGGTSYANSGYLTSISYTAGIRQGHGQAKITFVN